MYVRKPVCSLCRSLSLIQSFCLTCYQVNSCFDADFDLMI